jgi:Tfp pilus assembly protein PilO
MENNIQSKSGSQIYFVLLALLLSFLGIIFVITPKITSLQKVSDEAAASQAELDAGRLKVQAVRDSLQLIKSAQSSISLLGVAVPDQAKADEAVVQAATAASAAGLTLKNASVAEGEAGYVNLTVSADGDYDKVIVFLGNLEKNLRPVKVTDYSLSASGTSGQVSGTFSIGFPYLKESVETQTTTTQTTEDNTGGAQ